MKKRTIGTCERLSCIEPAHGDDGLCAFHHLEEIGSEDLGFTVEGFGSLDDEQYLALLLETASSTAEDLTVLVCKHGAMVGQCYLANCSNVPGLGLTAWDQQAAVYSEAIPYN